MSHFGVEYLANPEVPIMRDDFELVGILVHTGTAETGHYYSYIRNPVPSMNGHTPWLEFNDTEVTEFDAAKIPETCFGGEMRNGDYHWSKPYSAYMLFFRRVRVPEISTTVQSDIANATPKIRSSDHLFNDILSFNDRLTEQYSLLSPSHAVLIRSFLSIMMTNKGSACSTDHQLEKRVIAVAFGHVHHVISRVKDVPELESTLFAIRKATLGCTQCCVVVLEWIFAHREAVIDLILASPMGKARTNFGDFVFGILAQVRDKDPELWGIESCDANIAEPDLARQNGILPRMVTLLQDMMPFISKYLRNWDQYFILWTRIASMGIPEISVMLSESVFCNCVEILIVKESSSFPRSDNIAGVLDRIINHNTTRPLIYCEIAKLVAIFFKHLNVYARPILDPRQRFSAYNLETPRFPLTMFEQEKVLMSENSNGRLLLLSRLTDIVVDDPNENWPAGIVFTAFLRSDPAPTENDILSIVSTLVLDIKEYLVDYAEPVLYAAKIFCFNCPQTNHAREIIKTIASSCEGFGDLFHPRRRQPGPIADAESKGGRIQLAFFRELAMARAIRCNRTRGSREQPFMPMVITSASIWAPALLIHEETNVRRDAYLLLEELIFNHFPKGPTEDEDRDELEDLISADVTQIRTSTVRTLFLKCLPKANDGFQNQYSRSQFTELIMATGMCVSWIQNLPEGPVNEAFSRKQEDLSILDEWARFSERLGDWEDGDVEDVLTGELSLVIEVKIGFNANNSVSQTRKTFPRRRPRRKNCLIAISLSEDEAGGQGLHIIEHRKE